MLHFLCALTILVLLNPVLASAEEFHPLETLDNVIDQWKVFRTKIYDQGFLLETTNTVDVLSNVSGGVHRKTAVAGDLDLLLTIDMKKLVPGWDNGTLFVYGLGTYGDDPSKHVGDIQAVSSIAAPNTWKLFEAWYQHNLSERFSLCGIRSQRTERPLHLSCDLSGDEGTSHLQR